MSNSSLGRLLIVDDETELMSALRDLLADQGYETAGFVSGSEALAALRKQDFDILLSDLMMPEMDGITLMKEALEIDPDLIGIIMTGQATVQTAVDALKVGAFDYILKPFKLNAIMAILVRGMSLRRLRLENLRLRETVAIYELNDAISYTLDSNLILNKIADAAMQQCDADEASILLLTKDRDELYIAAVRGENREHLLGQRVKVEDGIVGWIARNPEKLILDGVISDPRFTPLFPRPDIKTAIVMPMLVGGRLIGILNVNSTHARRPFALGQVKALGILASAGASALQNAFLYRELHELNTSLEQRVKERTARLEMVNKELEAFSYSVSHDLRAPLRGIDGFSAILVEDYADKLDDGAKEHIKRIRSSAKRMSELIEALLGLSRLNRAEMRIGDVDMTALAGSIAAEFRERNQSRQVEFRIDENIVSKGDLRLLRVVMENLLGNAWKYTSRKENSIIEFRKITQGDQIVYFARDNGAGFDMKYAGKLFAPFQRMHPSTEYEGTGIGLATVQRIVERHGGRIWAEAEPGEGATFYFTLGEQS